MAGALGANGGAFQGGETQTRSETGRTIGSEGEPAMAAIGMRGIGIGLTGREFKGQVRSSQVQSGVGGASVGLEVA